MSRTLAKLAWSEFSVFLERGGHKYTKSYSRVRVNFFWRQHLVLILCGPHNSADDSKFLFSFSLTENPTRLPPSGISFKRSSKYEEIWSLGLPPELSFYPLELTLCYFTFRDFSTAFFSYNCIHLFFHSAQTHCNSCAQKASRNGGTAPPLYTGL